jgi:hypothetical protein
MSQTRIFVPRRSPKGARGPVALRFAVLLGVAIAPSSPFGCASSPRPFPMRGPLQRDTDLLPVAAPCRSDPTKRDPRHVACAPETYISPLAWDGVDNSVFRPLSGVFAVDPPGEALNANSLDEVPDSAWFTSRLGARSMSLEEIGAGACSPSQILPDEASDGSWVIDEGKDNGSTPGFRVDVPGRGKFLFKADDEAKPERATAASVIGAAAYHAVGFFTSCEQIVYFRPAMLKLLPGLRSADNSGLERPFDEAALQRVLKIATRRGDRVRMQASAWLPGRLIGPFRYEGTRGDDPNDIIAHEDRRELRGGRLLAAWLDHFDAREQNSMDVWLADRDDEPDSSPGYVRHYYLDMSDCLGSEWPWDGVSRRLGYSYLLDWADIGLDFISFGIPTRRWDRVKRTLGREKFGYFNVDDFSAEGWKNEYPNPAFSRMTERDGAWMARILARFTPAMVRTLAETGEFSDPGDTAFLTEVLKGRLRRILGRYLTRLSPLADVHVDGGDRLCAVDLADESALRPGSEFHYSGVLFPSQPLPLTHSGSNICVTLPHVAGDGGSADAAPERYVSVALRDGVAKGLLRAYLYDLGPVRGYQLAGVERTDP